MLLAGLVNAGRTQPHPPPLPGRGPSPLLFLRFSGPEGLRVTFFQGWSQGHGYDAPVVAGVRPGYIYRVELSRLTGHPGVSIFPTLEVRGSLNLTPKLNAANYPAPVVLTDADVAAVLSGAMVTKVIYLECADKATPVATKPGEVLETDLPANRDLWEEAKQLGRPMVVVRLGGRVLSPEEAAHESVPGTILLPGEHVLAPPGRPPCLPAADPRLYDPVLGPRLPSEECLHDGGDRGQKAALDADGHLYGLDPEDTVAEYTDACGRRSVVCSNRVCLCVPRFGVLRIETPLGQYDNVLSPGAMRLVQNQEQMRLRQPQQAILQRETPNAVRVRQRPSTNIEVQKPGLAMHVEILDRQELALGPLAFIGTKQMKCLKEEERAQLVKQLELARALSVVTRVEGNEQVIATSVVARVEGLETVCAVAETRDLTVCCGEVPCLPDKPLVLIKCADRQVAEVGDVVTFTLRYSNHGGRPMTDVAVTDSLSPRLEYVPGSAQADRDAVFTMQENEVGSMILRWEISGKLLPGQSGVLRFRAKIR
jgi:uncharacterized repeat protein (TIGR01451 family)